ncbi:MAG: hypothetical protein PHT07_22865 [Paludibacter sp.]|nr:hypothetical protein [Paludibacter sp.]
MKVFRFFVVGCMMVLAGSTQGQISVQVHIGTPPAWGPAGYSNVQYYYLPDVEAYYDVQHSMFIYQSGNVWVHRTYLPSRYRNYDLYGGYKVVMNDYHGNTPYIHFKDNKMKFAKGYRGKSQRNIGERNDRNYPVKSHAVVQQNKVVTHSYTKKQVRVIENKQDKHQAQFQGKDKNQKDGRENGNDKRK